MSQYEIKIWETLCNRCGATARQESVGWPGLPPGWTVRDVRDCGLTGYTRHDDLCPACSATEDDDGE